MPNSPDSTAPAPKRASRHVVRLFIFVLFVGLLPYLAFDVVDVSPVADYPLVFVLSIWAACLLAAGIVRARRGQGGALAFNLGVLCLALAAVELWIGQSSGLAKHMVRSPAREEYVAHHDDLGYAPLPDRASRFTAVSEGEEVYDVTYTIGADGLRARPPLRDPPPEGSVLCFGCSFTFGSGLEDDESIPWRLEEALDGRLCCYNFGFSGYGPHQMLANIESGRAEAKAEYPVRDVIYLAIPDHARRVTGAAVHDRRGPRYVLSDDGRVRREGTFNDVQTSVMRKRLFQFLNHSHLGQAITRRASRSEGSVALMVAVVKAAKDEAAARWPDSRFHVLLWDDRASTSTILADALAARGMQVTLVSAILPDFKQNAQQYRLHRADEHPNARAAEAIARYVAAHLIAAGPSRTR